MVCDMKSDPSARRVNEVTPRWGSLFSSALIQSLDKSHDSRRLMKLLQYCEPFRTRTVKHTQSWSTVIYLDVWCSKHFLKKLLLNDFIMHISL